MNPHDNTPLDAEERALAERLAILPASTPSAALDARILAEARAAVGPRRGGRGWRWPLGASAAALLAIAVFLPWQRGHAPLPAWESPPAATDSAATAGRNETAKAVADRDTAAERSSDAAAAPAAAGRTPTQPSSPPAAPTAQRRADAAPPAAEDIPLAAPAQALDAAARSAADAWPAGADAAALDAASTEARAGIPVPPAETTSPAPAVAAPAPAAVTAAAPVPAAPPTAASETADGPDTEAATAIDASTPTPAPRRREADTADAGFERVRALLAAGLEAEARGALAELLRQHPDARVPDDLRALREPAP